MNPNTAIPLSKLIAWQGNVRKTESDKGIDELAASIKAHGLLQSLVVRRDKGDKYAVVAGRRRLLALQSLAEKGDIGKGNHIDCHIITDEADATEISLVENVQREQMHPADEYEAFKALIDGGTLPADVAARFGKTETYVRQRLKLASVSPKIIALYRKGEMTLQHVMAFTVTDDHKAQERLWKGLPQYQRDPSTIRDQLTEAEITAEDRRVQFVTLKAYEKAGGKVRRDLFTEGDEGVFILDQLLLTGLVTAKLEQLAADIQKEGWKWVEVREAFKRDEWFNCKRVQPDTKPLSAKEQAELDKLNAEYEKLSDLEEITQKQSDRMDTISERTNELENGEPVWTPGILAIAGAVVAVGSDGEPEIMRGLVRPEDQPKEKDKKKTAAGKKDQASSGLSAALVESLTTHRTAALSATLMSKPDIAFAAAVYSIASQTFYNVSNFTCLEISVSEPFLKGIEGSKAAVALEKASAALNKKIPKNDTALWAWCLKQKQSVLMELLAFCIANSINAVAGKNDRPDHPRFKHADEIAKTIKLDMGAWFTPTAANYFGSVSRAQIIDDLKKAKVPVTPAIEKAKKGDLALIAEREIKKTGWLPELLRKPK